MTRLLIIVIILNQSLNCFAQKPTNELRAKIDSIVNPYIKQYSIVGMSIGIVDDTESYTINYGSTSNKDGFSVTDSTMFHIASITKVFTATAIMQFVEQGKLSLDDKLVDILPDFKLKSKEYDKITIKHLLTHTSGLPWTNKQTNLPNDSTSIPLFIKGLQKIKLNFKPGAKFSGDTYSNIGFDLLGIVVQKISNQPFHEYIYHNVLSKVDINQATYFYEEIDSSRLALPQVVAGTSKRIERFNLYRIDDKKNPILNGQPLELRNYETYGEPYIDNPTGNLITTSTELNKWTKYLIQLNNGTSNNSENIIERKTLKHMWTATEAIPEYKISLGLTWWIFDNSDLGRYICHFGNNPGFCSILFIFPDQNFGINILCNGMFAQEAVYNQIPLEIAGLIMKK
ncbi:MAG: beta-lactamase family protein [Saprospiraceae bacterium]|nr:beta-lactamase family protein [Saprospiraceae bacterium]